MGKWVVDYLGKKWTKEYDCYAFFKQVQKEVFGLKVYDIPKTKEEALYFKDHVTQLSWEATDKPLDGDAILMGSDTYRFHIGVCVKFEGSMGVVHNQMRHGVIFTKLSALEMAGTKIAGYYRFLPC